MTLEPGEQAGRNLRTLRTEARLSQKQFLRRLRDDLGTPMDQSTLSKKERGDRALSIDELLRYAAVLDVSPVDLLLPRTAKGDLQLSSSLRIPAAQAREWIRGWRRLGHFHGVPEAALTLQDQETRKTLQDLQSKIQQVRTEIWLREGLIEEAREEMQAQYRQPMLLDTSDSNIAGEPFRRWVQRAEGELQKLEIELGELQRKVREIERQAVSDGWMHWNPSARSL